MPKGKATPPITATINFKDALKDGIPHIEVTVTGSITVSKSAGDYVSWIITNNSSTDLEVKVVDFYALRPTPSNPGGTAGVGYPFSDGSAPNEIKVKKKSLPGNTAAKACDGDAGFVYKYSVVARVDAPAPNPNIWFLVKDPELELDL